MHSYHFVASRESFDKDVSNPNHLSSGTHWRLQLPFFHDFVLVDVTLTVSQQCFNFQGQFAVSPAVIP